MNILITGGTGYVGVNFVPALLERGHRVRILCRDQEKAKRLFGATCEIVVGDVTDKASLKGCCENIDVVFHMVAKVGNELPSDKNFAEFRKVNVEGVKNIVAEAKCSGVKRFIHISSIAAMGIVYDEFISEKSNCDPYLPYQVTKYEGEQVVLDEFKKNRFPVVVIRPTKVYGVGEREYSYLTLARMCKKRVFPKVGKGQNFTSNLYISDFIQGLVQLLDHGNIGETYILTSKDSIGFCESARILASELNKKVLFVHIPAWAMIFMARTIERLFVMLRKKPPVTERNVKATVTDRIYDISKAINEVKFNPVVSMQDGIRRVVRYYKEKGLV